MPATCVRNMEHSKAIGDSLPNWNLRFHSISVAWVCNALLRNDCQLQFTDDDTDWKQSALHCTHSHCIYISAHAVIVAFTSSFRVLQMGNCRRTCAVRTLAIDSQQYYRSSVRCCLFGHFRQYLSTHWIVENVGDQSRVPVCVYWNIRSVKWCFGYRECESVYTAQRKTPKKVKKTFDVCLSNADQFMAGDDCWRLYIEHCRYVYQTTTNDTAWHTIQHFRNKIQIFHVLCVWGGSSNQFGISIEITISCRNWFTFSVLLTRTRCRLCIVRIAHESHSQFLWFCFTVFWLTFATLFIDGWRHLCTFCLVNLTKFFCMRSQCECMCPYTTMSESFFFVSFNGSPRFSSNFHYATKRLFHFIANFGWNQTTAAATIRQSRHYLLLDRRQPSVNYFDDTHMSLRI